MGKFEMQQMVRLRGEWRGASADDMVDGFSLAEEAWGERCKDPNSGLLALAYLWRRFGPTWSGGDDYKSLVDYWLTTSDADVVLWLHLSGSELRLNVGYAARATLRKPEQVAARKWEESIYRWWFKQHPEFKDMEETEENRKTVREQYWHWRYSPDELTARMKKECKPSPWSKIPSAKEWRKGPPVMRRINRAVLKAMKDLLRPVHVRDVAINIFGRCEVSLKPAEVSEFAGYGVPRAAMQRVIKAK